MLRILACCFFVCIGICQPEVYGQNYPVTGNLQLISPLSPVLEDWASGFPNKFFYTLTLNDANEPSYQVRLKVTISGEGITLKTLDNFTPNAINLNVGQPLTLTGIELAPYFNLNNLSLQGVSPEAILQNGGRLPEGLYTVCIEVFDFFRFNEAPVSNASCSISTLEELDPPMIVAPQGATDPLQPQNLVFQWQPLHIGGFPIEYTLRVYKVLEGLTYDQIVSTTSPIYETQQNNLTTFLYGPSEPALEQGSEYLILLSSRDVNGVQVFKNNGVSEIKTFTYGAPCLAPINAIIEGTTPTSISLSWSTTANSGNASFVVGYRNAEIPNANWYEDQVNNLTFHTITGLNSGTAYEVRVSNWCNADQQSAWLTVGEGVTQEVTDNLPEYECGEEVSIPPPDPGTPLAIAAPGEIFLVNGFQLVLDEVNGGTGTFSGNGRIKIPFSNKVIRVEFTNIRVNNSRVMYSGQVRGISQYLDMENPNDWNFPPVELGQDICQPPSGFVGFDEQGIYHPTGLPYDPNGFDVNGNYVLQPPYPGYEEGDPIDPNYDPNGFDASGIHIETGTIYNPDGCAQTGLDSLGQPCNPTGPGPYYWLHEEELGPPTPEGLAFADSIRNQLRPMVVQALEGLLADTRDSITLTRIQCQGFRETMDSTMSQLDYDRLFIYGAEDMYYKEGMHRQFLEEPNYFSINVTRDPREIHLEDAHVNLYHCDQDLHIFIDLENLIISQQTTAAIDEAVAALLELISRFTAEEVAQYQDMEALQEWVNNQIKDRMKDLFYQLFGNQIGYQPSPTNQNHLPMLDIFEGLTPHLEQIALPDPLEMMASNHANALLPLSPDQAVRRAFEFNQGWEYIDGRHRAFYLDRMVALRKTAIDGDSLASFLPAVIEKEVAGRTYTILLDNILFTAQTASLDAFMLLELPNSQKIVFRATGLYFGPSGLTLDQAKLELASDVQVRLSNAAKLIIEGSDSTYVAFDCNGFAGMGIEAAVEFCRNFVVPLHPETLEVLPDPERVRAHFTVEMPAWGAFITTVNIDPFALAKTEDVKWIVEDAVLDFSETDSPEQIVFPDNYASPFVSQVGQASPLWKGFYLKELSVQLPKRLTGSNEVSISVQNVIIDDMGVSGMASVAPILSLDQGNIGGWAFSIDTLSLSVVANQFEEIAFNGLLNVPILKAAQVVDSNTPPNDTIIKPSDCLAYECFLNSDGQYGFSVQTQSSYRVDIWQAQVNFRPGTSIEIFDDGDGLKTLANLHGTVAFQGASLGAGLDFGGDTISFQNVQLSNKAPYFSPGTWSYPSISLSLGGFSLTFQEIGMYSTGNVEEAALGFNALINLSPSNNMGLTACGNFKFIGNLVMENQHQKWRYDHLEVNDIFINASAPGFGVSGGLSFYENDNNFGSGFRGMISAWFKGVNAPEGGGSGNSTSCTYSGSLPGWGITAMAQFGTKDNFDYFLVDAMVDLGGGVPILGPAIKLKAFGGGVYHHMSRNGPPIAQLQNAQVNTPAIPPLGTSLSGIQYLPNANAGYGIKATVLVVSISESAVNANLTFEINFNNNNGIDSLSFYGNASFMKRPEKGQAPTYTPGERPENGTPINAYLAINFDFVNHVLSSQFEIYAFIANGTIKGGINDKKKMGWADLLFTRDEGWYIKAGSISERNKIIVGIPGVAEKLITFSCYLMIGNRDIPAIPQIAPERLALIGVYSEDIYDPSRSSLIPTGAGFAFGANFTINTGEKTFLIFYGSFSLDIGFDISVLDYGDAQCVGSSGPIGINGWYATGQLWAIGAAEIGIKVRIFGRNRHFNILQASAGAVLYAQLPNPFSANGAIGGTFDILGGLISGSWNFLFEFGEECQVIGASDPVALLSVIESVEPTTDQPVPVDVLPRVNFIVPVDEAFAVNNGQETEEYIVRIDEQSTQLLQDGTPVPFQMELSANHHTLTITPIDFLRSHTEYTFVVTVYFEEKSGENWEAVREDGAIVYQSDTITFTTDEGFDFLVATNVAASYPQNGQYNFYRSEYSEQKGYILLKRGQEDLFTNIPEGMTQKIRLKDRQTGQIRLIPLNYSATERKVVFPLLPQWVSANHLYRLEIVNLPSQGEEGITAQENNNNGPIEGNPEPDNDPPGPVNQNPQPIGGGDLGDSEPPSLNAPKVLYTLYFRVSQYSTFLAKATEAFVNLNYSNSNPLIPLNLEEPFDVFELNGFGENEPLVELEATMQEPWFLNQIIPFYYEPFPVEYTSEAYNKVDFSRGSILGFPPSKAIAIEQIPEQVQVRAPNYLSGYFPTGYLSPNSQLKYLVESAIRYDHESLIAPCLDNIAIFEQLMLDLNLGVDHHNDTNPGGSGGSYTLSQLRQLAQTRARELIPCMDLVASDLPQMSLGTYQIRIKYRLPGLGLTTSIYNTLISKQTTSN